MSIMKKAGGILVLFLIILCINFACSADVSVYQGQYYKGTIFQKGVFEFTFDIYDSEVGGNNLYSDAQLIETGEWGQWRAELQGVNEACNDASKDYFMEITIDGVPQLPRKRLTNLNYQIGNVLKLNPIKTPLNPELGTVYKDYDTGKLRYYDGAEWLDLIISKVSEETELPKKPEKEEITRCSAETICGDWSECAEEYAEKTCLKTNSDCSQIRLFYKEKCTEISEEEPSEEVCEETSSCSDWGKCINGASIQTCTIINADCSEDVEIEEKECSSENPFEEEIQETIEKADEFESVE